MATERRVPAGAAVLRGEITTAIRQAVMRELAEVGYGRLSIEAVARRAGVGKTAVYRRWGSKLEMVLELVTAVAGRSLPLPDTGTLIGDLEMLLRIIARALQHPLASQIIPDLLAEAARNPAISRTLSEALLTNQRDVGALVIGRAVERGELPVGADPDAAIELIVGPIYWRLAVARTPLPKGYLTRMATSIALALGATDPATGPAVGTATGPAVGGAVKPAAGGVTSPAEGAGGGTATVSGPGAGDRSVSAKEPGSAGGPGRVDEPSSGNGQPRVGPTHQVGRRDGAALPPVQR